MNVADVSFQFQVAGRLVMVNPTGSGNVNDTYLAIFRTTFSEERFIVQRMMMNEMGNAVRTQRAVVMVFPFPLRRIQRFRRFSCGLKSSQASLDRNCQRVVREIGKGPAPLICRRRHGQRKRGAKTLRTGQSALGMRR